MSGDTGLLDSIDFTPIYSSNLVLDWGDDILATPDLQDLKRGLAPDEYLTRLDQLERPTDRLITLAKSCFNAQPYLHTKRVHPPRALSYSLKTCLLSTSASFIAMGSIAYRGIAPVGAISRLWARPRAMPVGNLMMSRKLTYAVGKCVPKKARFFDSKRVKFQGGRGGDGCISMLSVFGNEFAGPDGGNGGCGGHVVLRANSQVKSLNGISNSYTASPGVRGMSKDLYGANADHVIVEVPIGTIVTPAKHKELAEHEYDPDKSEIVAELHEEGSMFIAARGGSGGRGNASYLSNFNRHPRVAEAGAMGESNTFELRMKFYAQVGLIGLPNAGKSTLLNTLTGADVEVGNYTFTTRHPQVGVLEYCEDFTQLAISDLPGLIEDSHKNRGMGLQFLRSLQRCMCLLYVIDLSNKPIEQMNTLRFEMESFKKGLTDRPHLILANKIDHPCAASNLVDFKEYLAREMPRSVLIVGSSLRGDNLEQLRQELKLMYQQYQDHEDSW